MIKNKLFARDVKGECHNDLIITCDIPSNTYTYKI